MMTESKKRGKYTRLNIEEEQLKKVLLSSIPIIIYLFLSLWFQQIQGTYVEVNNFYFDINKSYIPSNTYVMVVLDSLARVVTHIDKGHLTGNIKSFVIFYMGVVLTKKMKTILIELIISILAGVCIYMYFVHIRGYEVVGFSVVVFCLFPIAVYSVTKVIISFRKKIESEMKLRQWISLIGILLFTFVMLSTGGQIIADVLILSGVVTFEEPEIATQFADFDNESYTIITTKVHIAGFIFGCLIVIYKLVINRINK